MSDVFISYSRRDKEFVHILHNALEKSDKKTWVDWEDILPTSEWWQEIENAIAGSDTFIFVISPASIASEYCNKEVEYAFNLHKRILPIVRQDVTDITQVQAALSRHQWIFFRESDDFEISFQRLLEAIALDLEHIHVHTKLLVRAIEWNEKKGKDGFLLRGEELEEAEKWLKETAVKSHKPTDLLVAYIQSSRKVEDVNQNTNQALRKAARNGIIIAIAAGVLQICGLIGLVIVSGHTIKAAQDKIDVLNKDAQDRISTAEIASTQKIAATNKEAMEKIASLELLYQNQVSELNYGLSNKQKKASNPDPVNTVDVPQDNQNEDGSIYIQVPTESKKQKIENLPTALTNSGYKASGIEVVGMAISPNIAQVRYFFNDSKTKSRAIKLQQKLNELGYKEFVLKEVVYVKGFEKKTKPEMLEIWFAKDAK